MSRTVVLTGKAVVNFKKVIRGMDDDELTELQASTDLQESQIDENDLLNISWIHDGVEIQVTP